MNTTRIDEHRVPYVARKGHTADTCLWRQMTVGFFVNAFGADGQPLIKPAFFNSRDEAERFAKRLQA